MIFINEIEITHSDIFNAVVVHGLQGFATLPSHFSCNIEKITSLAFSFQQLLVFLFPVASHVPHLVQR
ncbi:hypothetical protein NL676_008428 [Syzygium grande]|nr:hypothetical protein NL676_008428 [Syzygium grande]